MQLDSEFKEIHVNNDVNDIFRDLEEIRDIMLELNIITAQQGEQLGLVRTNIATSKDDSDRAVGELIKAQEFNINVHRRRQAIMRGIVIASVGGLGTIGFIANPVLGAGALVAGCGVGWIISRPGTVDAILKVIPKF